LAKRVPKKALVTTPEMTIEEKFQRWKDNPYYFVTESIGIPGTDAPKTYPQVSNQQREFLELLGELCRAKAKSFDIKMAGIEGELTDREAMLAEKRGISVMAGKGVGKDGCSAWAIIWFLIFFKDCKILATAPVDEQLKTIVWAEVTKWLDWKRKGEDQYAFLMRDLITVETEKIYYNNVDTNKGKKQFCTGKTSGPNASEEKMASTLSGRHAENQMFLATEASGIPDPVIAPLNNTMTGRCNFAILIFNPNRRTGFAHDTHYGLKKDLWCRLHWDAEKSSIVSPDHIAMMEKDPGRDSDDFRVNVTGLPPLGGSGTLIPWDWVDESEQLWLSSEPDEKDEVVLGVDPARDGGDATVICIKQGKFVHEFVKMSGADGPTIADKVMEIYLDCRAVHVFIDANGIGASAYDYLRGFLKKNQLTGVLSQSRPRNREKFNLMRDELWYTLRDKFERNELLIPKTNGDLLKKQLTSMGFSDDGGKIRVHSKRVLKKNMGTRKSPDEADALALACFRKDSRFDNNMKSGTRKDLFWAKFDKNKESYKKSGGWMAV
jgi:hypothetical protein